jgi:hypothetical protein
MAFFKRQRIFYGNAAVFPYRANSKHGTFYLHVFNKEKIHHMNTTSIPAHPAFRFLEKKYYGSEKRLKEAVKTISAHPEVAEEYFLYTRTGKMSGKVSVKGLTAENLRSLYGLTPLGAYYYLASLLEEGENL